MVNVLVSYFAKKTIPNIHERLVKIAEIKPITENLEDEIVEIEFQFTTIEIATKKIKIMNTIPGVDAEIMSQDVLPEYV